MNPVIAWDKNMHRMFLNLGRLEGDDRDTLEAGRYS